MGYFCTYTPVEILHASGFIPVRIHAGTGRMDKAGQHLPDFICPYMKLSLENALDGKYDFLAGLVQGYSCDAACGLVNIWKDIFKERFFHTVPLPYKDTPEARAYYRSALLELTEKLNSAGGHFSETGLKDSIDLYARIRSLQFELDERRRPAPDMLMSPGGGCVPVIKIFQELARRFPDARVFHADLPQVAVEDIQEYHIDYAMSEGDRLADFLTETTGRRLDEDRLEEVVRLSDRACALWDEIMTFRRYRPVPFSAAEMGIMFVMVTLQGTQTAVDYLTRVRDEVRQKAEAGIGVIENEKIRLFWDNIPLWYNMGLFNYFEKNGGVVVAETYSAAWSIRLDTGNPKRALALKSLMSYPLVSCVSINKRKEMVLKACRDYAIDGVIFHRNKSCLPITLGQMEIKEALEKDLGISSVIIDADHMDERNFSLAQFQTRVDAFMEMLLNTKE